MLFQKLRERYSPFALFLLSLLYMSQGLPHGFVKTGLQTYLRDRGYTLTQISFTGMLMMPWMFKAIWAPFADRFYSERFGRRRSWIFPLQIGYLLCVAIASTLIDAPNIMPFLIMVFGMSLFASAQDVSVDGLAIDTLKPHALGLGNAVQVIGYRMGMLLAGAFLLPFVLTIGWDGYFGIMAVIVALPLIPILFFKEKPVEPSVSESGEAKTKPTLKEIFRTSIQLITNRELKWVIIFLLTYKIGEEMVQSLYTVYLRDHGFALDTISRINQWGMFSAMIGSVLAGLLLTKFRIWTVLGLAVVLRIFPIGLQYYMSTHHVTVDLATIIALSEHLPGSLLTTATFAFMMSLVSKRVGATEYTILASCEVMGKFVQLGSGKIADTFGYQTLFLTGLVCSILVIYPWYKCRHVDTQGA
ncbi:MAG: MFS transporter [Candidatus Uhrbacteria bacterium]|nr:MFS transporter [Candidatus Uhrbacteria bacterium]